MLNRVVLIGRLTKDVELRYTQSGKAVANFTLAVNRKYQKETADFIPVTVWGEMANNCEKYLSKGKIAAVDGRLELGSYEKDGIKHLTVNVNADDVRFLSPKGNTFINEDLSDSSVGDDDLPF